MKEEPQEEEQPPVAELDEEALWLVPLVARMGSIQCVRQEQKLWFLPRPVTDMVAPVFNSNLPLSAIALFYNVKLTRRPVSC